MAESADALPRARRTRRPPGGWRLALTAALLTLLSWPVATGTPCTSTDCSYEFALHASLRGYYAGVPVTNFTYGPLGALSAPEVWFRTTGFLAMGALALVQFVLIALTLRRAQRVLPVIPAALIVLVASRTLFLLAAETAGLLVILLGAEVAERRPQRPVVMLLASAATVGFLFNVKASTGLLAFGVAAVLSAGLGRPGLGPRAGRVAAVLFASLAFCFIIFSAVTGQPGAWSAWLRGSYDETAGFGALALEPASRADDYVLALVLLVLLVLLGALLRRQHGMGLIALMVAGGLFVKAREGFVRHDGHVGLFFSAVAFLVFAFPLQPRLADRLVTVTVPVVCFLAYGLAAVSPFSSLADLSSGPRGAWTVARQLTLPGVAQDARDEGRADIRASLGVPQTLVDALQGHPVEIDPFQTVAVYGYDLDWGPTNGFADYQSYTDYLDRANAASARHADPNRRILRPDVPLSIDGHFPAWDSPAYQLELICSWQEVARAASWQLLEPTVDRCGASTALASVEVQPGETVPVPQPRNAHDIVTASISLRRSVGDQVATRLFKPLGDTEVTLDGEQYRLVVATADGPMVVRVPAGGVAGPGATSVINLSSMSLSGDLTGATVSFREIAVGSAAAAPALSCAVPSSPLELRPIGATATTQQCLAGRWPGLPRSSTSRSADAPSSRVA